MVGYCDLHRGLFGPLCVAGFAHMAKEIISDLSEPVRKEQATPEELIAKRWHFALSVYAAAMLYAFLHKAVLPFLLGYLGTSRIDYTHISYGVIWILVLGYTVHKEQEVSPRVQLLMGTGLAFACFELGLIFFETRKGWMVFSHVLAGVPLIASILNLLRFASRKRWGVIVSGFLLYSLMEGLLWKSPQ